MHTPFDILALVLALSGAVELWRRHGGGRIRTFLLLAHLGAIGIVACLMLKQYGFGPDIDVMLQLGAWVGVGLLLGGSVGLGLHLMTTSPESALPPYGAAASGLVFFAIAVALLPGLSRAPDAPPIWIQGLDLYQGLEMTAAFLGSAAVMAGCVVAMRRRTGRARRPFVYLLGLKIALMTGYGVLRIGEPEFGRIVVALVIALDVAIYRWMLLGHRMGGIDSEAVYSLVAGQREPVVVLDHQGGSVLLNASASALFGKRPPDPAGVLSALRPVTRFSSSSADSAFQVAGDPRIFEVRRLRQAGVDLEILLLDDISAHEIQARALAEANERLEEARARMAVSEKMAAIGTLAAGVAHEINNPVAYVTSNLGTLREYLETLGQGVRLAQDATPCSAESPVQVWGRSEEAQTALEDAPAALADALDGCRRIQETVASMRTLSRQNDTLEEASLAMLAADAVRIATTSIAGVRVITHLEDPLPIQCATGDLTRVIMNLVVNAGQACGPGKVVTVAGWREGRTGVLEVADNGPGIPYELQTRIFEPFFTTKPVGQGTGLGLSISFQTIRQHGGELRLYSTPGQGSRFQVRLGLDLEDDDALAPLVPRWPNGQAVASAAA